MSVTFRRADVSQPWAADLNPVIDCINGIKGGQIRQAGDDGVLKDTRGGTTSTGNYAHYIRSAVGKHLKARKSDDSADVLSVDDTGATITGAVSVTSLSATGAISGNTLASATTVQGTRLISTVATGTAPLTVASTTNVANLNASTVIGLAPTSAGGTAANALAQTDASGRVGDSNKLNGVASTGYLDTSITGQTKSGSLTATVLTGSTAVLSAALSGTMLQHGLYQGNIPKAWVEYDTAGVILTSFNISSIVDNGLGNTTVNFTRSFANLNYVGTITPQSIPAATTATTLCAHLYHTSKAAGTCQIIVARVSDGAFTDPSATMASFMGAQ